MRFKSFAIGYIDVPNLTTLNIYTVGCPHKCTGCHTPELQDQNQPADILTMPLLLDKLESCPDFFQGICWLGGDPLFQFTEYIKIAREIKRIHPYLINVVYTGYLLEQFTSEQYEDLLSCTDVIIDGPWRGIPIQDERTNQKIWINNNINFTEITYKEFQNKKY